jgi:hypothetical protein
VRRPNGEDLRAPGPIDLGTDPEAALRWIRRRLGIRRDVPDGPPVFTDVPLAGARPRAPEAAPAPSDAAGKAAGKKAKTARG